MIGFLRGILLEKEAPNLLVEVNGIGYEIQMPLNLFCNIPTPGKELSLYIHQVIREDGNFLYGFTDKEQRFLFRSLIKISSIGPKIALAILSTMDPKTFKQHLYNDDSSALESIPGIGAKTAKRLVIEMRDKISKWENISSDSPSNTAICDATSALISLGYKEKEARLTLGNIKDKNLSSEELIRLALKKING